MASLIVSLIVCVSLLRTEVAGSRILMSAPEAPSHIMIQSQVASELIARGHEVYMAMASRLENPETLERLGIKILYYRIPEGPVTWDFDKLFAEFVFDQRALEYLASAVVTEDCSLMMQDESFKRKAKELSFDLAILEPLSYAPCNLILGPYLEIPFVSMSTFLLPWELRIPALPSYYRILGTYPIVDEATFTGRITNLVSFIVAETSIRFPLTRNTTLLEQYAPELRSWKELVRKSELILTNIDHHMGLPLPGFPYLVTVPGLSALPAQTLEPALESLVNGSKHGIIVMSLGSMVRYLPSDTSRKFFEAFSRLKQTVIARMEPPTDGTIVPKNVKLFSWLPQNDLLGHANTRLFITHCGNSGQHEFLYHGVPFVGFPMFGDQHMNGHLAEEKGYGVVLNIFKFESEELYMAIEEILKNENYTKAIKKASDIFRHEPMTGRQKVAHWIEHVNKYGGSHLRSKSLDLPLYQFLMMDILAVLVILSLIVLFLIKYLAGLVLLKICDTKSDGGSKGNVPEIKRGPQKLKTG